MYRFPFEVSVGESVHFLRGGIGGDSVAAIITEINSEGVVDLVEIPRFGGVAVPRMGVRYESDPWHSESPEQSRESGARKFRPAVAEKQFEQDEERPQQKKPIPEPAGRK